MRRVKFNTSEYHWGEIEYFDDMFKYTPPSCGTSEKDIKSALYYAWICREVVAVHAHIANNSNLNMGEAISQKQWHKLGARFAKRYIDAANQAMCKGYGLSSFLEESTDNARQYLCKSKDKKPGFVYLLQSPSKAWKIGRTKNPKNRMRTFEIKLPFEVKYKHIIKTDDMYALEKELHERFDYCRGSGEWFDLAPDDVEYIKSLGGTS